MELCTHVLVHVIPTIITHHRLSRASGKASLEKEVVTIAHRMTERTRCK